MEILQRKLQNKKDLKSCQLKQLVEQFGHNPISIIIPCHRVVGTSGNLTGYAGGIGIKKKLLELEKVDMSKLYVPKNVREM